MKRATKTLRELAISSVPGSLYREMRKSENSRTKGLIAEGATYALTSVGLLGLFMPEQLGWLSYITAAPFIMGGIGFRYSEIRNLKRMREQEQKIDFFVEEYMDPLEREFGKRNADLAKESLNRSKNRRYPKKSESDNWD